MSPFSPVIYIRVDSVTVYSHSYVGLSVLQANLTAFFNVETSMSPFSPVIYIRVDSVTVYSHSYVGLSV